MSSHQSSQNSSCQYCINVLYCYCGFVTKYMHLSLSLSNGAVSRIYYDIVTLLFDFLTQNVKNSSLSHNVSLM